VTLCSSLRQYAFKLQPALRHRPANKAPRPQCRPLQRQHRLSTRFTAIQSPANKARPQCRPLQRHHRPSTRFTAVQSPARRSNKEVTLCCSPRQYAFGLQAALRHRRSGGSAPRHHGRPLHHRGRPPLLFATYLTSMSGRPHHHRGRLPSVLNAKRILRRIVLVRDRRQREGHFPLEGTSRRWPQHGRHRRWPPQRHHRPSARFTTVQQPHHFPHTCSTNVLPPHLLPQKKYQSHRSGRRIQRRQHVQQVRQSSSCHWCHCSPNRSFRCHSGCSSPVRYRFQHGCLHRAMQQLACHRQHTNTYSCPGGPQGSPPTAHGIQTITSHHTVQQQ